MDVLVCRACGSSTGDLVLDLGRQPPADRFPRIGDTGPDATYELQMWLCSSCGLAQLVSDPTSPEEPLATEPAALVAQAADAVDRVAAEGLFATRGTMLEYRSPHGGSWLDLLGRRGLVQVDDGERADVVVDSFGMMHAADQAEAVARRVASVSRGGMLLLQFHSLETIVVRGQWNALRHGHYAYYSTTALRSLLAPHGFTARRIWQFALYGGTILLAAARDGEDGPARDDSVDDVLAREAVAGVRDPAAVRGLQAQVQAQAIRLHDWLVDARAAGTRVLGYGAASRAVALLVAAGVDRALLPAVVDVSSAKQGCRMPGTDIPIVGPAELAACRPEQVLLFLPDLLPEVRAAFPDVESAGGQWVDVEAMSA